MSNENTTTMNVVVHKAAITLAKGESIGEYTGALSSAGRTHILTKLGITKDGGAWMAEANATQCIFSVYSRTKPDAYYAMPYQRDSKTGVFTFGATTEVKRKTTFVSKKEPGIIVVKADEALVEKSAGTVETKVWQEVKKDFWGGVL